MNKETRKRLSSILEQITAARDEIEDIAGEEREKFDNMPEGLQSSEKGEAIETAADTLDEQIDALDNIIGELEELTT